MTKHHTAWIHFSPQLVLILLTGLQKDPFLHSGERVEGREKKPLYEAYIYSTDLFLEL